MDICEGGPNLILGSGLPWRSSWGSWVFLLLWQLWASLCVFSEVPGGAREAGEEKRKGNVLTWFSQHPRGTPCVHANSSFLSVSADRPAL